MPVVGSGNTTEKYLSTNLTCLLPRRGGPKPCDEPCGNHSSSHHQFSCVKNDIAAKPLGCLCQTLPWTWPAESLTDQSEGCNSPSVIETSRQPEEKKEIKTKKTDITMQWWFQIKHLQQQACWQRTCFSWRFLQTHTDSQRHQSLQSRQSVSPMPNKPPQLCSPELGWEKKNIACQRLESIGVDFLYFLPQKEKMQWQSTHVIVSTLMSSKGSTDSLIIFKKKKQQSRHMYGRSNCFMWILNGEPVMYKP